MAAPVLLVADDLAVIASARRILAREGYELVLATSAADALIAFGHHLPALVVLHPKVESDRGAVVCEELLQHPDGGLARVLLLGETVPGFSHPVVKLPLDSASFVAAVQKAMRGGDATATDWTVFEQRPEPVPAVVPLSPEAESWRATLPPEVEPPGPLDGAQGDGAVPADEELSRLEADVRAEAARRRRRSEARLPGVVPEPDPSFAPVAAENGAPELLTSAPEPGPAQVAPFEDAPLPDELSQLARERDEARAREDALAREAEVAAERARAGALAAQQRDSRARGTLERAIGVAAAARVVAHDAARADAELRGALEQLTAELDRTRAELDEKAVAASQARGQVEQLEAQLQKAQAAGKEARDQAGADAAGKLERSQAKVRALEAELEQVKAARDEAQGRLLGAESAKAELQQVWAETTRLDEVLRREREEARATLDQAAVQRDELKREVEVWHARFREQEARLEAELARRAEAEKGLGAALKRAEELETRVLELEPLQGALEEARAEQARLEEARAALEEGLAQANAHAASDATARERAAQEALERARAEAGAEREAAERAHAEALEAARRDAEQAAAEAQERQRALAEALGRVQQDAGQATEAAAAREQALKGELAHLQHGLAAAAAREQLLQAQLAEARDQAEAAAAESARRQATLEAAVAQAQADAGAQADAAARREAALAAEAAQAGATAAQEKAALQARVGELEAQARALEERLSLPVKVEGRAALLLARAGTLDRPGLAQLVCQLVLGKNDVRLELGTTEGVRTLWLSRGSLVGAESGVAGESLVERARRDGLIDARQEAELRMLRLASPRDVLEVLKSRGFVRPAEVVPLVQRYSEAVALDALSEAQVAYRLQEETPGPEALLAESPRGLLPILAEAIRRGLPPEALLELLGGADAVPSARESPLDLRALGFTEKERRLLAEVDGQLTVEGLVLASGMRQEAALRALLVSKYLGLVVLAEPRERSAPVSPELDARRLLAKYDEVQDGDYFTILGLGRGAGADEVRRAYERLSREFDPLRFAGHPDARLVQRARAVAALLEEAARALEDDRRRAEYARHLLD